MSADRRGGVRLDVYLTKTRLIMPRSSAKRACDNGIVSINGNVAKPAALVEIGDTIEIRFTDQDLALVVEQLPGKSVRKSDAARHYRLTADRRYS